MGHEVVLIPGTPASDAVREGVMAGQGKLDEIESGVIEAASFTWIYTDDSLTKKLANKDKEKYILINEDQLTEWLEAVRSVAHRPS